MCLWNLWQTTVPWSAINFVFSCEFLLVWGQRGRRKGTYPSYTPYFPSKLRIWIIDFPGFDYCYAYLKPSRENFIFLSHQISTSQFGTKVLDSNSLVSCNQVIYKLTIVSSATGWKTGKEKISFQSSFGFFKICEDFVFKINWYKSIK